VTATELTRRLGIELPIVGGAMYPCSNPELVAAVSEAGGIGVVQPMTLTHVYGHELRAGLRLIRGLTRRPIGFNAIVERSSRLYLERMRRWVDVALEEGVTLLVTALGNPDWVVARAHAAGALVFHDVTARRFAQRALDAGVDGLICVNDRAGGHAGDLSAAALFAELADLGVPLVCAGGIGDARDFADALALGYAGVQLGTRLIATPECHAHDDYKQAILRAKAQDIVRTEKLTGVPVAVIDGPWVRAMGTRAGPLARRLLRHRRAKHWVRALYSLRSLFTLPRAARRGLSAGGVFQAGCSVEHIDTIEPVAAIVRRFAASLPDAPP
jgi:nitronate monooxygenase